MLTKNRARVSQKRVAEHPLHSLSSYLGGFPPRTPRQIIQRWVPPRATVLDPFCGAGTTLLESKLGGRRSVGIDLNPLATVISAAKTEPVSKEEVLFRIRELASGFRGVSDIEEAPETLEPIFHRRTLTQLCYLKGALDDSRPEDRFLRGCILGIMHGKGRKAGGTAYLSVDMPNTFSMSPQYVRQFVVRQGLRAPLVDVFAKLRERVEWLLRAGPVPRQPASRVLQGDATQVHRLLPSLGIRTVGAVVTSPPYLGVLRYGAFNWIRLWFLDLDPASVDRSLDGTDSLERYLSFMASFLTSVSRVLRPGGVAAMVIGDVVEHGQYLNLAPRVWEEMHGVVPFQLIHLGVDAYDAATKTTRVWGEAKKGRATPQDRLLVLQRTKNM